MLNKISNITLDYQRGILLIDDKLVAAPVKVVIKQPDGWDVAKLFNSELAEQGMVCPELVIDVRDVLTYLERREFKELIREAVKDAIPAELAGTAGIKH